MKNIFTSLLFAVLILPVQTQAEQRETIVWTLNNFTPYIFVDGPNKGKGIIDQALNTLSKRLTHVNYEYTVALNERLFEMMKSQPNVCSGLLFKNDEREKIMDFTSRPIVQILPNGIITTRDRLNSLKPYMNDKGELKLDAVLADGKFRLAVDQQRSYGPNIDQTVKNPVFQEAILKTKVIPMLESKLLKLVNQKEYDLTLGYAVELKSAAAAVKMREEDFSFIPIAGEPALRSIPLSCSKSDIGRKFLTAADKLLADPAVQEEMAGFYRQWLDAETAKLYDRLVKQASLSAR